MPSAHVLLQLNYTTFIKVYNYEPQVPGGACRSRRDRFRDIPRLGSEQGRGPTYKYVDFERCFWRQINCTPFCIETNTLATTTVSPEIIYKPDNTSFNPRKGRGLFSNILAVQKSIDSIEIRLVAGILEFGSNLRN